MTADTILSSDSDVIEPPDLWTTRIEPRFRERAPRVVQEEDGDWSFVGGIPGSAPPSTPSPRLRGEGWGEGPPRLRGEVGIRALGRGFRVRGNAELPNGGYSYALKLVKELTARPVT